MKYFSLCLLLLLLTRLNRNYEMKNKPNHNKLPKKDIFLDNEPLSDKHDDLSELTDSFLSVMDSIIKEKEEVKKLSSSVKTNLPDLTGEIDNEKKYLEENIVLDEETLARKFDEGGFDKDEVTETEEPIIPDNAESLSENREKRIFYSALHLAGKPVEMKTFHKMLNYINLENRLLSYAEDFNQMRIGLRIRMVSGGYQMVTDSDVTEFLEKYFGERTEFLSRASLETSAIIAYRQPVTKAEVEEMREVNSSGTMKYLLDKNLIKVVGRKQVPGKPLLYATTKYFLEYFGLNDLSELPTFREWQELKQNQ